MVRQRICRLAVPAGACRRKRNSVALFLLLLPGHRRHQVRNRGHRTLGIAAHRPCLFRQHHHRGSLAVFHSPTYARLLGPDRTNEETDQEQSGQGCDRYFAHESLL